MTELGAGATLDQQQQPTLFNMPPPVLMTLGGQERRQEISPMNMKNSPQRYQNYFEAL